MDVFLVPVGNDRYELYCEVSDEPADEVEERDAGFVRRLIHRFREMVAEAERERRQGVPEVAPRGWLGRIRARTLRWVAESIAEQRLLWHLRKQNSAALHFPDDLDEALAMAVLRQHLTRDFDKHRFWLVIDALGLLLSALLTLIPGPNLLAYYFAFRLVGHYFSMRGARCGLDAMAWQAHPSAPLTELRQVLALDPHQRESRVHAVAASLRLEHLVRFFERAAVST